MRYLLLGFVFSLSAHSAAPIAQIDLQDGLYERDAIKEAAILKLEGAEAEEYIRNNSPDEASPGYRITKRKRFIDIKDLSEDARFFYNQITERIPLTESHCGRLANYWSMPTPIHYFGSVFKNCLKSSTENSVVFDRAQADTLFTFSMKFDGEIGKFKTYSEVEVRVENDLLIKTTTSTVLKCNEYYDNICSVLVYKKK